jgi:hypothetical protein
VGLVLHPWALGCDGGSFTRERYGREEVYYGIL